MKKSKNARKKLFSFFGDTVRKPRGTISVESSCSLHSRGKGRQRLQDFLETGLFVRFWLGRGLGGGARLSCRAGDAEAHQQKTQALAQGIEQVHDNFPFRSIRIELEKFSQGIESRSILANVVDRRRNQ
jgi:hypothetical protein